MDINLKELVDLIEVTEHSLFELKQKILHTNKKMSAMGKNDLFVTLQNISYFKPQIVGNLNNCIDSVELIKRINLTKKYK